MIMDAKCNESENLLPKNQSLHLGTCSDNANMNLSHDESQLTEPHKTIENIIENGEKFVLNEFIELSETIFSSDCYYRRHLSAEKALRSVFTEIIQDLESRSCGKDDILQTDSKHLYEIHEVRNLFRKTEFLKGVDLNELHTIEDTTCFLINLTNLLWIHAFIHFGVQRCSSLKNWFFRQIFFNSIGYNIGELGFVSLYNLHCALLNFPLGFQKEKLDSLNFSTDPRIHFLVAQTYLFSPKIQVVNPESFENCLAETLAEYVREYVYLKNDQLCLPVSVLLFLEKKAYDEVVDSSTTDKISKKQTILLEILKLKELRSEILLTKDSYFVNESEFEIHFENLMRKTENETHISIWRHCQIHRSFYQCIEHHSKIVTSTILEDDHAELDPNSVFIKMEKIFQVLLPKFENETDYSNDGLRCFYSSFVFTIGFDKSVQLNDSSDNIDEALQIYNIVQTVFAEVPTNLICKKIRLCLRILKVECKLCHSQKWFYWYDLFFGDPDDILIEIVARKNGTLACQWVSVQLQYQPNYHFSSHAWTQFISLLEYLDDTSYLQKTLEYTCDIPFTDIFDSLIQSQCSISKLIRLVSEVINFSHNLDDKQLIKFHSLLIGLKIISRITKTEQVYYYQIIYNPLLIVEQLIINRKINILKEALIEVTPLMLSLPEKLVHVEILSRAAIDELLKSYGEKALYFHKETFSTHCEDAIFHAMMFKTGEKFFPPDEIPSVEDWIPNNWAEKCLCCQKAFSIFIRRHHCRRCGRVICATCSSKKLLLNSFNSPQRVCDQCFKFENKFHASDDCSSQQSSSSGSSYGERRKKPIFALSADEKMNESVRIQAAFDTAPDIELCFSLLELHSENISVPRFLLINAEKMLKILRRRFLSPANFDYSEVTHIIRSLLIASKVYYVYLGEMQGIRQCEELTSEVDILNQLAAFKFIPGSDKPIRNIDDWKQIRNVLLEKRKWELALEISTKNGLECTSIWYLWGMHLLKSEEWSAARDKFSKSNLWKNPKMLNPILEILSSDENKEPANLFGKLFSSNAKKSNLMSQLNEERLYYLKTYGNGDQLFDFYIENEQIVNAVHVAYLKKTSVKNFLNKVYVPYLKNNNQMIVLKHMEHVDEKLVGWKDYIHEICVYCTSNKYLEALYEVQLWIKDYYRAAISATMLYRKGARTYLNLMDNSKYLDCAVAHFESAISRIVQKQCTVLEQTVEPTKIEVFKYTVNLQKEVTKFICQNFAYASKEFDVVPSFFETDKEKLLTIILLVDALENLNDTFHLLLEIVNAFNLDLSNTLNKIVVRWIKTNKEELVKELMKCVKEIVPNPIPIVDSIAVIAVREKTSTSKFFIDNISNENTKFQVYLEMGYLKEAYLMAVKMKRNDLVEKIYYEAVKLKKITIQSMCTKKLGFIPK